MSYTVLIVYPAPPDGYVSIRVRVRAETVLGACRSAELLSFCRDLGGRAITAAPAR